MKSKKSLLFLTSGKLKIFVGIGLFFLFSQNFGFADLLEYVKRCILHDVPNQPLFGGLREDALISYTFEKFLETEDEERPLLFPMTKAVVRAMDAVEEFARKKLGVRIEGFLSMGTSKRGWTTWLTPVVDKRVRGIIPIVYDNLNLPAQLEHQIEVWGKYKIHLLRSQYRS